MNSSKSRSRSKSRAPGRRGRKHSRSSTMSVSKSRTNYYTAVIPKAMGFFAPRMMCTLKYQDNLTLTISALSYQEKIYRTNSLYDPDQSGSGHQPYGFDQLAAIYNRYRVYAMSWRISIPYSSATAWTCVVPVNGSKTFTNTQDMGEYPRAVTKPTGFAGAGVVVYKGSVYLPKISGIKRHEYATDDRTQAVTTTDPNEVINLHLGINNLDNAQHTYYPTVTLLFKCELFDILPENPS